MCRRPAQTQYTGGRTCGNGRSQPLCIAEWNCNKTVKGRCACAMQKRATNTHAFAFELRRCRTRRTVKIPRWNGLVQYHTYTNTEMDPDTRTRSRNLPKLKSVLKHTRTCARLCVSYHHSNAVLQVRMASDLLTICRSVSVVLFFSASPLTFALRVTDDVVLTLGTCVQLSVGHYSFCLRCAYSADFG